MARAENKSKYKKVSVWNWLGTLILCSIPGVRVMAVSLFIICGKAQSKRGVAIAMLLLDVIAVALVVAAVLVFPDQLARFAADLRGGDALLVMPQG